MRRDTPTVDTRIVNEHHKRALLASKEIGACLHKGIRHMMTSDEFNKYKAEFITKKMGYRTLDEFTKPEAPVGFKKPSGEFIVGDGKPEVRKSFDPDDKSMKPPMHLCPVSLPVAVATVFGRGAHNRPDYDWLDEPRPYTRYMDSLERHINAFKDGHVYDSDTGMPHLWHAATCLAILIEYEKRGVGTNDIYEHKFERQGEPK